MIENQSEAAVMDIAKLRRIFSTRIRKLREGKLNQGEFADSVGVSRGAMSYYEQEARTPDIGVLRAICVKYKISADYLLGIMPDPNHAVSDVCRETGLSPESARRLKLITRLVETDIRSPEHLMDVLGDDYPDAMKLAVCMSVPELLNVLFESDDGIELLTLLSAVILGAEVDGDEGKPVIKLKSASKNFEIAYPVENITDALWVNIQNCADRLRQQLSGTLSQKK
jgi:transcriptional regulator with XRE-family HTH domain